MHSCAMRAWQTHKTEAHNRVGTHTIYLDTHLTAHQASIRSRKGLAHPVAPPDDPAVRSRIEWVDIPDEDAIDHRKGREIQPVRVISRSEAAQSSAEVDSSSPMTYGGFEVPSPTIPL